MAKSFKVRKLDSEAPSPLDAYDEHLLNSLKRPLDAKRSLNDLNDQSKLKTSEVRHFNNF